MFMYDIIKGKMFEDNSGYLNKEKINNEIN